MPGVAETPSRRADPATWERSRWSALGWGTHCKRLMPCYPERCRFADRVRCEAPPGDGHTCTWEIDLYRYYLDGYHRQFNAARPVYGDAEYLSRIRELAFLEVRMYRIKMRQNWLDLNRDEALVDVDWFAREVNRTFKYATTARNHWLRIVDELTVASLPPTHGTPDIMRVAWIRSWIEAGTGPVCDLATHEVTFNGVWENYHQDRNGHRWENMMRPHLRRQNDDRGPDEFVDYIAALSHDSSLVTDAK